MLRIKIAIVFWVFLSLSCDKVVNPIEDNVSSGDCVAPEFKANTNTKRNILIEDYTGHQCGNCPEAPIEIEDIKQIYGDQIISVAIHTGSFAVIETGTGKYETDFTTRDGDELMLDFGVSYFPSGSVSRYDGGGGKITPYSQWSNNVQAIANDLPVANIQIKTESDLVNNSVCIFVETEVLQTALSDYNLVVILTEDSIVDWQKNYGGNPNYSTGDVPNYVHNHVLRDHVNGTYGELAIQNGEATGVKNVFSYSYELNSTWNYNQLSVIAYLFDSSNKEVIQVSKLHLK